MLAIYPVPVMVIAIIVSLAFSHKVKAMPVIAAGIVCGVLLVMRAAAGIGATIPADLLAGFFLIALALYVMARQEGLKYAAHRIAACGAIIIAASYVALAIAYGDPGRGVSLLATLLFAAAFIASGVVWRGKFPGKR